MIKNLIMRDDKYQLLPLILKIRISGRYWQELESEVPESLSICRQIVLQKFVLCDRYILVLNLQLKKCSTYF